MKDVSTIAILVSVITASLHLGHENNNSVEAAAAMAHVAAASANRSSYSSAPTSTPSNVEVALENSKDTTDDLSTPNSIDVNQPDMNMMNLPGTH